MNTPLYRGTDEYRRVCWYCGVPMVEAKEGKPHKGNTRTRDHVTPLSRGGGGGEENLVPCCKRCNEWKNNRTLEEFRAVARPGEGDAALFYGEIREREIAAYAERRKLEAKPVNTMMEDRLKAALGLREQWEGILPK